MKRLVAGVAVACLVTVALNRAQAPAPFKLGTFERNGRPFVGIVLGDAVVVNFAAADAAIRTPASQASSWSASFISSAVSKRSRGSSAIARRTRWSSQIGTSGRMRDSGSGSCR